ncbi:MAG TPA: DUF4412 domain-containing protein [Bacteroidota bacterium]|jgi:hypothetical protein|nr:DUF4412 domain-containing protein [Bacteroidota bacterium]
MKNAILALSFFFVVNIASSQFEGKIDMKVTRGGGEQQHEIQYTMSLKKGMLAFTTKGGETAEDAGNVILRSDKNLLWIINDKNRTYLEIVADDKSATPQAKTHKKSRETTAEHAKSILRKTGKKQTLAGYECEEWIGEEEEEVTSIWGTTKLGNVYEGFTKAFGSMYDQKQDLEGWQQELIEKKVFPMKTTVKEGGEVTETQEVTKVEPKSLAATIFEPPAGYKKQAMGAGLQDMMKGLKSGDARPMDKKEVEKLMQQLKGKMEKMEVKEDSSDQDDDDDDDH